MTPNPAAEILIRDANKTQPTITHELCPKIMKTLFYKFLVLFFYYIGDLACKFDLKIAFEIYQKAMRMSIDFDEEIGYWWWTEPTDKYDL